MDDPDSKPDRADIFWTKSTPTQPPVRWVAGLFPGDKVAGGVALTSRPLLAHKLCVLIAIPPPPHIACLAR